MKALINFLLFIILPLSNCSDNHNTNHLESSGYSSKETRVKVLEKEIKSFSPIEDAEFDLFNVNGFSNNRMDVPGSSSWDYKFVIRVAPKDVDKWISGMTKIVPLNPQEKWMKELIEVRETRWQTSGIQEFYTRNDQDGVDMIVFRNEGIIFKRVKSL